jgi:hypothetical protein
LPNRVRSVWAFCREKIIAIVYLSAKFWRNLVVLTLQRLFKKQGKLVFFFSEKITCRNICHSPMQFIQRIFWKRMRKLVLVIAWGREKLRFNLTRNSKFHNCETLITQVKLNLNFTSLYYIVHKSS